MRTLEQLNAQDLNNRRVILRVDFNVPVPRWPEVEFLPSRDCFNNPEKIKSLSVKGQATSAAGYLETFRIKAHRETVEYLVKNGAKVLLLSHLSARESFQPMVEEISSVLNQTLTLVPLAERENIPSFFSRCPVLLLDNIRQDLREEKNDPQMAAELAAGFDFFVNDAFAVSHRAHTSVVGLAQQLPSYAGFLMRKEISSLSKILEMPAEGKIIVLGGAKIATKLPVIKNFLGKAEKILIGGALANNFFKAQGFEIGASVVDEVAVLSFLSTNQTNESLILPRDIIIATRDSLPVETTPLKNLGFSQLIADIGPRSAEEFAAIIQKAKTVVWNGPMGLAEKEAFTAGTRAVAEAVAQAPFSVVGGGDTVALLSRWGWLERFSFVSTGGGAMLEFLAGKKLPGLEALDQN